MSWDAWVRIIILAIIVGGPLRFGLRLFFAALFDSSFIVPLDPNPACDVIPGQAVTNAIKQAVEKSFTDIGTFRERSGGIISTTRNIRLLLSPESDILVVAKFSRAFDTYDIVSQLADGRWIITSNLSGSIDLSGLE